MYSKKIHFIGHSLGTAVTAYAANIFLRQTSYLNDAQVTILDYPNNERVDKMLDGFNSSNDRKWARKYGFDKNFFASTLPSDIDHPSFNLHIDNYFSAEPAIDSKATAGVGSTITGGAFYNHEPIEDPSLIGELFLPEEGAKKYLSKGITANDHSGVHQWYRWTIKPNEDGNFAGDAVCSSSSGEWNKKPLVYILNSSERCDPAVGICKNLGDKKNSLNPCNAGWLYSIIDSSVTFPSGNGKEVDKTSSFGIEPSNVTEYGCAAGGIDGSYICREDNQSLAPQAAAAEFAEMDSTEPEDAPDRFYIELDVNVPEFVRYISFDYTFTNVGDGDYVYLFAEGESIWLMSGNDAEQGKIQFSGQIPLRMTAGANKLIVALYGVGEKKAEFKIENFKFTTVADTDNDGYGDDDDVFPDDPAEWEDTDEDDIGNNADLDDDNDGFQDTDDTFPLDPDENADTDGDGIGDNADTDDGMYPDHAVISSAVDKAQLAPGENFTYSATVKNQGTGRARTTTLRYYRSTDSTVDSNDTPLGTDVVGTLNSGHTSLESISLVAPITPGTYWIGSCVDPVSGDSNLDNNCGTAVQITVASGQPDLLVSNISLPSNADSRELFNITATFKNQGALDATPVTANIYYMNPATGSTSEAVYQMDVPALAVNETVPRTATVQAPCESGDYALAVCVNPGMNVESNSNNNCSLRSLSVSGDCPQSAFLPAINLLLLNGQE